MHYTLLILLYEKEKDTLLHTSIELNFVLIYRRTKG